MASLIEMSAIMTSDCIPHQVMAFAPDWFGGSMMTSDCIPHQVMAFAPDWFGGSDSSLGWNPMYYIIGREQSRRVEPRPNCSGYYTWL
jgi:hypothetical protein